MATIKMWDGKPYVPEEKPRYVHQGRTAQGQVISLPGEQQTISALAAAGGGTYTNTLHSLSFAVAAATGES